MKSSSPKNDKPDGNWSQVGLALSIPTLLAAGPLVGLALGWLICRATGWGLWVQWVLMILGMVAGIRETIKVIQKLS